MSRRASRLSWPRLKAALAAALFGLLACVAHAQDASALAQRYSVNGIDSPEAADQALREVEAARSRVGAQYAEKERACYSKFFATVCLDQAKEEQRVALTQLRDIEVQAQAYKRRWRVGQRDKDLAERRAAEEADAPRRQKEEQEREQANARKAEARAQRQEEDKLKQAEAVQREQRVLQERAAKEQRMAERAQKAGQAPVSPAVDSRVERHEERVRRAQADEAANASRRAENVEAYQRKVEAAAERQRQVAARKAEKERERAAKAKAAGAAQQAPATGAKP